MEDLVYFSLLKEKVELYKQLIGELMEYKDLSDEIIHKKGCIGYPCNCGLINLIAKLRMM